MATALQEQARGTSPTPYQEFDSILVDGTWRRGGGDRVVEDRDPYTGDVLVRIPSAGERDLDEAYRAAEAAQAAWAARGPSERSGVLRRAASIMEDRRDGDRRLARPRVGQHPDQGGDRVAVRPRHDARGGDLPVAVGGADPPDRHRRQGEPRLPDAGRGGRHDQPVELPAHLSNRSIAPALALGNAVGDQAGVGHAGDRRPAPREDLRGGRACRPACSTWWSPVAARSAMVRAAPGAAGDLVHRLDRGRQAHRRARRTRPDAQEAWPSSWAGTARPSSSTTPTSASPSTRPSSASSCTRARSAWRPID